MQLQDQVAIVTGGGRNIGEAAARLFASEGAAVGVIDLNEASAIAVANAITKAGGRAIAIKADVSNEDDVRMLVDRVASTFGKINIVINNVAISDNKSVFDLTVEEWDRVMAGIVRRPTRRPRLRCSI